MKLSVVIGIVALLAGTAHAQQPPEERAPELVQPTVEEESLEKPMTEQMGRELYRYGKKLKLELRTFELGSRAENEVGEVEWLAQVDPWRKRGRLSFGAGNTDAFALRFDTKMQYEGGGRTRTQLTMDLTIADHTLRVEMPDVFLRVTTVYGEAALEATVPVIEVAF